MHRYSLTESDLNDIFDSADKPLDGDRWWLKAEDPFQCLAICVNLAKSFKKFVSRNNYFLYLCPPDGSCNGLHHYAALGKDKLGASAVNLVEGERPADVYLETAARIGSCFISDANNARLLINQITLAALGEMFEGARNIMNWLGDCAK
ncbi:DNA-directed RNA polymerase 2B, chloroplastic/mitochondrial, partial [Tanacetum coccineum]